MEEHFRDYIDTIVEGSRQQGWTLERALAEAEKTIRSNVPEVEETRLAVILRSIEIIWNRENN